MEITKIFGVNLLTEKDYPNPTKSCLFDQDTSITLFTISMNKIWTSDPFKTFIFADMTLLGSKVGKGGLE